MKELVIVLLAGVVLTIMLMSFLCLCGKKSFTQKCRIVACIGGPLDRQRFNNLFVEANQVLAEGNTEALKKGIALLIEGMDCAGDCYAQDLVQAISNLRCALSRHDRADTKGPWNRDLSGYGVMSWKNDLWERDRALLNAWPHIKAINDDLKKHGLGWTY